MPYDATSSWSGYQYQGKVAIFHVLKLLNELNEVERIDHSLEIEWLEDFSILKNDDYISAHQVKAYISGISTMNRYFDAMCTIYENKSECLNYLHVVKEVEKWSLEDLNDLLTNKIIRLDSKIKKSNDTEKVDILKEKEKLRLIQCDIAEFFKKTILYSYPQENNYCELNYIENLIKEELKKMYRNLNLNHFEENVEIIYLNCLGFIDRHVRDRHVFNQVTKIKFNDIFNLIRDEKLLERGESYHLFKLKEKLFFRDREDYCEDCIKNEENCNICNLNFWIKFVEVSDEKKLKKVLKAINPNIEIDNIREENNDLLIKDITNFFTILDEINQNICLKGSLAYFESIKTYFPTTLRLKNSNRKEVETERVKRQIEKNDDFLSLIEERGVLITDGIEGIIKFEEFEDDNLNKEKNIFLEEIILETLEDVKGEINR